MSGATAMLALAFGVVAFGTLASGTATTLGLPLAAALVLLAIVSTRPRGWAWRLAAAGSLAWTVEEVVWALNRAAGTEHATFLTDATYVAGVVLWGAALLLLRGRRLWSRLWLFLLPAVGIVVWLLVVRAETAVALQFPFIDALLLVLAMPALEPALRGRASEGRVLIVLAFFLRAVGSASFAWIVDTAELNPGAALVWIAAYGALAIGSRLELSGEPAELFVVTTAVVLLQVVIGTVVESVLRLGQPLDGVSIALLVLLAYCQLVVLFLIVYTQRMRWLETESELKRWGVLVADLGTSDDGRMSATGEGQRLLRALRERLPALTGLVLHDEEDVVVGQLGSYAYPLVAGGTEVARLQFAGQPRHMDVLDAVAPFVAGRIRQSQLAASWADQALTDPLTGILNRRGFAARCGRLVSRARADGVPMSVVMVDLDRFKRVNDFYGHSVGDSALKELAAVLTSSLRPDDAAIRWGGEEFLLVLYDADTDVAVEVVRRTRQQLRERPVPPIDWSLSFSAGVAGGSAPNSLRELERWVDAADEALAKAKAMGRDRYEVVA